MLHGGHEEDEYSDMEVGFDEYSVEVGLHQEESSSENRSDVSRSYYYGKPSMLPLERQLL